MNSRDRHRKLTGDLGTKLRTFFNDALVGARYLPGRRDLRARIEEEFAGYEGVLNLDKLEAAFVDFAKRGQNRGARWGLRGVIDETVVSLVTKIEEADRLIPVEEPTAEEIGAAIETAGDPYADRIGGDIDRQHDQEQAEALEVVRKAGLA